MMTLKEYLALNKITQAEFAEAIGVKQATVSRLAEGKLGPKPITAIEIERQTRGAVPALSWPAFAPLRGSLQIEASE